MGGEAEEWRNTSTKSWMGTECSCQHPLLLPWWDGRGAPPAPGEPVLCGGNAGMLYFQNDPFWTAGSLSRSDYLEAANQSVCKLADMLEVIKDNTSLILNFQDLPPDHPYYTSYINITLKTILASGIQQQAVSSVRLIVFPKLNIPMVSLCS